MEVLHFSPRQLIFSMTSPEKLIPALNHSREKNGPLVAWKSLRCGKLMCEFDGVIYVYENIKLLTNWAFKITEPLRIFFFLNWLSLQICPSRRIRARFTAEYLQHKFCQRSEWNPWKKKIVTDASVMKSIQGELVFLGLKFLFYGKIWYKNHMHHIWVSR